MKPFHQHKNYVNLDESRGDGESQPGGLGVLDNDDVVGVSTQALDFLLPAQVPNFDRPATYGRVKLMLSCFVCCTIWQLCMFDVEYDVLPVFGSCEKELVRGVNWQDGFGVTLGHVSADQGRLGRDPTLKNEIILQVSFKKVVFSC